MNFIVLIIIAFLSLIDVHSKPPKNIISLGLLLIPMESDGADNDTLGASGVIIFEYYRFYSISKKIEMGPYARLGIISDVYLHQFGLSNAFHFFKIGKWTSNPFLITVGYQFQKTRVISSEYYRSSEMKEGHGLFIMPSVLYQWNTKYINPLIQIAVSFSKVNSLNFNLGFKF